MIEVGIGSLLLTKQQKMNTMDNTNFIKPSVDVIKANLDAIYSVQKGKEGLTFAETAQIFLMDKFGYTQIQAQEIYEELEKGLAEYTVQHEAIQADSNAVSNSIVEATAGYSPEERTSIYVNVLTSLQLIDKANADAKVEALRAKNSSLSNDELVDNIVAALDGLPFQYVMDGIKDGITPEAMAMIGGTRNMHTQEFKLAAALVLYTAQQEGTANLTTEDTEISPRIIGAMAGAGADAMSATADLQEGKISPSIWQTVLKCILSALFTMAFAAICTFAIISVNTLIASAIFSVFGFGFITTLLVIPAVFYFTKNAIKTAEAEYAKLIDKFSPIYNSIIVEVISWAKIVIEKIKAGMQVARQKVVDVASNIKAPKQNDYDNTDAIDTDPVLA